jgi:hypothetical protein
MTALEKVNAWNAEYGIGKSVIVTRDNGTILETYTRSQAIVLNDQPVIWVEGITGCYLLDRVEPR